MPLNGNGRINNWSWTVLAMNTFERADIQKSSIVEVVKES